MSARWHVDDTLLTGWADSRVGAVLAASVEQHVARCTQCRERVRRELGTAPPRAGIPDLEQTWAAVRDTIELPPRSRMERVLNAFGLSSADALLGAAAPGLRGAWLSVVSFVLLFVVVAGYAYARAADVTTFLMVAPLVPVVGVSLAYSAEADPALEQEAATPYPKLRLVLLRTAAVLAVSLPVVAAAGLFVPGRVSYLWLLPAAGFTATVLAASTWTDPVRPAIAVILGWVTAVSVAAERGQTAGLVTGPSVVIYTVLLAGGLTAFILRTRHFGTLGGFS